MCEVIKTLKVKFFKKVIKKLVLTKTTKKKYSVTNTLSGSLVTDAPADETITNLNQRVANTCN